MTDLTQTEWQEAANAALDILNQKLDSTAVIFAIADALNIDDSDAVPIYETLISNSSPCWVCGTGIGDNRVEYFEDLDVNRYMHPVCAQNSGVPM